MKKHTSDTPPLSIPTWETLEGWIRDEIEVRIQSIAEEEVTQFLGRGWYERKGVVDAAPGYRNGYGKLYHLPHQLLASGFERLMKCYISLVYDGPHPDRPASQFWIAWADGSQRLGKAC